MLKSVEYSKCTHIIIKIKAYIILEKVKIKLYIFVCLINDDKID